MATQTSLHPLTSSCNAAIAHWVISVVFAVQNLLQTHPVFPHPSDCQFYFTCFFGKVRKNVCIKYNCNMFLFNI
jgi:hypothetical protein